MAYILSNFWRKLIIFSQSIWCPQSWLFTVRHIRKDEKKYYEELMEYSRKSLMLFPYHLSDVIVRVLVRLAATARLIRKGVFTLTTKWCRATSCENDRIISNGCRLLSHNVARHGATRVLVKTARLWPIYTKRDFLVVHTTVKNRLHKRSHSVMRQK
jgi:hypothetical protein